MKNRTKTFLLSALFALLTGALCLGVAVPSITAAAWSSWTDAQEHLVDVTELSYDANGWETNLATGAWQHGGKATEISGGMTKITTQTQGALINNVKLDITGGKAASVKFTLNSEGAAKDDGGGIWFMLVTEEMYLSGQRLNPSANQRNGLPVAVNFAAEDDNVKWNLIHYEHNGFSEATTKLSGNDATAEHTMVFYPGAGGTDKSFVMVDDQLLYAPNFNVSAFEKEGTYSAYIYVFQKMTDATLTIGKPEVIEKPNACAVELPATKRIDVGGEGVTLTPVPNPALEGADATYEWETSAQGVATVEGGTVVGVTAGTANITVKAMVGGEQVASATCVVTVCDYDESGWLKNASAGAWGIGVKDGVVTTQNGNSTFTVGNSNEVWNKNAIDLSSGIVTFDYTLARASGATDWLLFDLMTEAELERGERVSNANSSKIAFYTHNDSAAPANERLVSGEAGKTWNAGCEKTNRVVIYLGAEAGTSYIAINGTKIMYSATLDDYNTDNGYKAYLQMFPSFDATEITVSEIRTGAAVLVTEDSISMQVGETKTFDYELVGADSAEVTLADEGIVSLDADAKSVTGLMKGTTKVNVTAGGYTASITVEVGDIVVDDITLSLSGQVEMKVGDTLEISFTVTPDNYTEALDVFWTSGKTSRATVTQDPDDPTKATIKAVGEGIVDISVEVNGITKSVTINVSAASAPDSGSASDTGSSTTPSASEDNGAACSGGIGAGSLIGLFTLAAGAMLKKKKNA